MYKLTFVALNDHFPPGDCNQAVDLRRLMRNSEWMSVQIRVDYGLKVGNELFTQNSDSTTKWRTPEIVHYIGRSGWIRTQLSSDLCCINVQCDAQPELITNIMHLKIYRLYWDKPKAMSHSKRVGVLAFASENVLCSNMMLCCDCASRTLVVHDSSVTRSVPAFHFT